MQYRQNLFWNRFLIMPLFILTFTFSLKAQEVITLQVALDSTLENNLQLRQAGLQSSLSNQDVLQSRMNLFPRINGGIGGRINGGSFFDEKTGILGNTTNKSVDGNLSATVTLFQGFQRINQIAMNKARLSADKSYADQLSNELQLTVFTTYMEGLTNRDLMEASKQQLKLSEEQFLVEEIQMEAGNKTLADLSQARSQVALDRLNVTSAENAYELSILTLKQLMEMDLQREVSLENPLVTDLSQLSLKYTMEEIVSNALGHFPEIRKVAFDRKVAEQGLKVARGAYYPTLSFSSGLSSGYTTSYRDVAKDIFPFRDQLRNNFSQYLGLSLSIPIFNNFNSRIDVKKAKINLESSRLAERQTKNALNKVVHQAVLDFRSSQKRYSSAQQAFLAMEEAFVVIKERYDVGLANAIELSVAQTNRNKSEFDLISAKYNVLFRNKVIDYYLGKPFYF